jgi:hypothetical protein
MPQLYRFCRGAISLAVRFANPFICYHGGNVKPGCICLSARPKSVRKLGDPPHGQVTHPFRVWLTLPCPCRTHNRHTSALFDVNYP